MEVRWLGVASLEAREARRFYDARVPGLGDRFLHEVRATLHRITELPRSWPDIESPIRRALVNHFPYFVHYAVEDDVVTVLGVYHARRRPISWRGRLEDDR